MIHKIVNNEINGFTEALRNEQERINKALQPIGYEIHDYRIEKMPTCPEKIVLGIFPITETILEYT